MQRAAIARALMGNPEVLLADEPTGNLDAETGREILDLLISLNGQNDLTIIMVTHDEAIARAAHRVVRLRDGSVREARGDLRAGQDLERLRRELGVKFRALTEPRLGPAEAARLQEALGRLDEVEDLTELTRRGRS